MRSDGLTVSVPSYAFVSYFKKFRMLNIMMSNDLGEKCELRYHRCLYNFSCKKVDKSHAIAESINQE